MNTISFRGDIVNAIMCVPREHRREAAGLLGRVIESGADPFTATAAVYRDIHHGLCAFFRGVIHREI